MALSIKDPEVDRSVRELARETGESITAAVKVAVRERLKRVRTRKRNSALVKELNEIALRCASLPDRDTRSPEDIIGYDEHGLPR